MTIFFLCFFCIRCLSAWQHMHTSYITYVQQLQGNNKINVPGPLFTISFVHNVNIIKLMDQLSASYLLSELSLYSRTTRLLSEPVQRLFCLFFLSLFLLFFLFSLLFFVVAAQSINGKKFGCLADSFENSTHGFQKWAYAIILFPLECTNTMFCGHPPWQWKRRNERWRKQPTNNRGHGSSSFFLFFCSFIINKKRMIKNEYCDCRLLEPPAGRGQKKHTTKH